MNPMDIQKSRIVISRHWNNPAIKIDVTDESITVMMSMQEFLDALCTEIGNPASMLTEGQLRKRVRQASDAVLSKMKEATNY